MTTREAFIYCTSQVGWYKECKIPYNTAMTLKRNFKKGSVSIDRMESVLKAGGYSKKPEVWKKSKKSR
jgi:hypothetical protein